MRKEEKAMGFIGSTKLRRGECSAGQDCGGQVSMCYKKIWSFLFLFFFIVRRKERGKCWNAGQRAIAPTLLGLCLLCVNMRIVLPMHLCVISAGYMVEPYGFWEGPHSEDISYNFFPLFTFSYFLRLGKKKDILYIQPIIVYFL